MDEVHKPQNYTIDDLKRVARSGLEEEIITAKARLIDKISKIEGFSYDDVYRCVSDLECVIFQVPEHQFGQDTDASETVLERLRREFEDLFKAPLEEVAGRVGMLGNIIFHEPDESFENVFTLAEIGCISIEHSSSDNRICTVHFEIGVKERVGREARFEFFEDLPRDNEFRSIPEAFKELVRILEEQGQLIPKI